MIDSFDTERIDTLEIRVRECETAIYDLQHMVADLFSQIENNDSLDRVRKALSEALNTL